MFNLSSFAPNQNPSLRYSPTKSSSSSFVPGLQQTQPTWENSSYLAQIPQNMQGLQENFNKEDMPYNIRVLLENERPTTPSSSGSEETDQMPDFARNLANIQAKEWDFGSGELGRRKSEIVSQNGSTQVFQNTVNGFEQGPPNTKAWTPLGSGKVNVKPSFFSPLNLGDFNQNDKKAYFVTIEGYNQTNSKRFFKIERLCYSLQGSSTNRGKDVAKFLYLSLWNDCHNNQEEMENIFEPWIYAVPHLHFRLVIKVYMTHAQEDPFIFDFPIDLRQFALPTQDKRTQSLEIVYAEQATNQPGNNITLHVQVTNEKLLAPPGFRDNQDPNNQASFDYTIILRQFFVGLPLTRTGNFGSQSPLLPHMHRLHDVYGKRGSAISLGQDQKLKLIEAPQSPLSWSNFSGESSPNTTNKFTFPGTSSQLDPLVPPGIMTSNNSQELGSFRQSGSSIFKFNKQQRYSIQPVKREPEGDPKKFVRMQTSDLSCLAEERGSLNVINAAVKAFMDGSRKESIGSESTSGTNFSTIGKFQQNTNENDAQNKSQGTPNASYLDTPETIQTEEVIQLTTNTTNIATETTTTCAEEFKIESYVGKMVEYAKTYQGSKVLQKYVATAAKDDLDLVVKEIGEKIGELMLDPYANYMIQTLVQNGNPRQRLYLLQKIASSFTTIARDKKGTHSLQAIVALIDSPEEHSLMRNIVGPFVFELSMDPRANYVIQKLINIIPPDSSSFLYQPLFDNFVQIANNSFGLLVLKQMMARVEQKDALKHRVVELTCLNFEKLIQNPYGNYAIQHIVENYPKESIMIMNKILTKIIPYSSQKISSNVIEKCLIVCDPLFRRRVVEEILRNGRLGDLMKNKYGNFVTLQLLASAVPSDKQKLMQEIYRCANAFNGTKYKTRWLKFVEENPMKINMNNNSRAESERQLEDEAYENAKIDEEKLEAVKGIWREMTKEEKNENSINSSFQSFTSKTPLGKKNYHKRDDSYSYRDK